MAKQANSGNKKPGLKKAPEKKPLIDPKYKNPVSTAIIIIILVIFFIVNNTRKEPQSGPYPPYYSKEKAE